MHVYVGNALTRKLPCSGDGEDYPRIFQILKSLNYTGGVTCVSQCEFSFQEAVDARNVLKEAYAL